MGLSAKTTTHSSSSSNEGWGLGLFLVFFPDDGEENKFLDNKKRLLSPSSTNASHVNSSYIVSKAQSTISICAFFVILTLFLFTLSTFDHTLSPSPTLVPRRWLAERNFKYNKVANMKTSPISSSSSSSSKALQGMGTLFRRGTRAMTDLVVAHLTEDLKDEDLRIFLRALHLSGVTARADVVLLFSSLSKKLSGVIREENESFLKLVSNSSGVKGFDLTQFTKERTPGREPLWGKKIRTNSSSSEGQVAATEESKSNEMSYGSVVGFHASELDPAESLSGFLDHIPIRVRRWACYPMLLGRVRRNFKHIMLVDAKDVILLGDSLARARHQGAESVQLWKNSEKAKARSGHDKKDAKAVTADAIMGGMRGVRWLSNAMLNEIVRNAIHQRKTKSPVTDSSILNQIVNSESLLRSLNIVTSTESAIPSANSLVSMTSSSSSSVLSSLIMVHRDNNSNRNNNNNVVDVNYILHREICSSVLDSFVYKDCYQRNTNI